jgi:tetratricopeptide (TPR) repeat protein
VHYSIRYSLTLFCLLLLAGCRNLPEERFSADTRINGKPVVFAYDTGAEGTVIFTRPAKRLGLKVFKPPAPDHLSPGESNVGHSGLCRFTVGGETCTLKLLTLHLPWPVSLFFDVDGLIGWPDMADDYFEIDAAADAIKHLDALPDTNGWIRVPLYRHADVLALQVPGPDGVTGVVEVDTGNPGGISLAPDLWNAWRDAHKHARGNHDISFMPGSGLGIGKTFWASRLEIGPLTWTNVPVQKANQTEMGIAARGDRFEASVGIMALKPFEFVVDQKDHAAYLRSRGDGSTPHTIDGIDPSRSTVHLRLREHEDHDLAQEAFNSRNFSAALYEINRLLAVRPDDLESLYFRGDIHYSLHQWNEAAQDYLRAAEVDPDNANYPQYYTWVIRARSGHRAVADQALAAYVNQTKKSSGAPWENEIGAFLLGQVTEEEFLRAASDLPGDKRGHRCEAWFYAGTKRRLAGDAATARKYFKKCLGTRQKDEDEYSFAAAELGIPD